METLEYTVRFNTPAFLGNAEQQAQWRTPPFKALLRQWWRVVKGPSLDRPFDVDALRKAENALFGAASDDGPEKSHQSLVRLRLKHWEGGNLGNDQWPKQEMRNIQIGQGQVRADVYLGFGPVVPASKKLNRPEPKLDRRAIDPAKQSNELSIRFDQKASDAQMAEVQAALQLAGWFSGIGSRSRNGWGSLALKPKEGDYMPTPQQHEDVSPYCLPLQKCFERDWPHAIGMDEAGALIWIGRKNGQPFKNWREAVYFLATVRRDIRAAAKQFGRNEDISANQLIAYPVTKSNNTRWGDDERIAGSLRLKVVDTGQGILPVAVHLPCAVPKVLLDALSASDRRWISDNQVDIWKAVHQRLGQVMARLGEKP